MTRDDVLREFGYCGWCEAGICSGDDNKTASHHMADEIVRLREVNSAKLDAAERERDGLRERLAAVEAERDALREQLTDEKERREKWRREASAWQGACMMAADTLGGEVEGKPTHEGNFLQRLRQAVANEEVYFGMLERTNAEVSELNNAVSALRDRADRAERILAALREPSEAVVENAARTLNSMWRTTARDGEHYAEFDACKPVGRAVWLSLAEPVIRAAVAAAEQEVLHNEGLARIGQRNAELFKRGDKCRCGKCADFGLVDIDLDSTTAAAEKEVGS